MMDALEESLKQTFYQFIYVLSLMGDYKMKTNGKRREKKISPTS